MKYHITKEGKEIELSNLSDSHLRNIIKRIERQAEEGITIVYGPEFCGYIEFIYGKELLEYKNYSIYIDELKRRNTYNGT